MRAALMLVLIGSACGGGDTADVRSRPVTDRIAGTDRDTGVGSTDTDTDTGQPAFADRDVLVVPERTGLTLLELDGAVALHRSWSELVGSCDRCGGEGASADGSGLLVSFTNGGFGFEGGVARIGLDLSADFRLDGFTFPHDAQRDPADQAIMVAESTIDRITWIAADGSSAAPVRALEPGDADWPNLTPNGLELFAHDGRTYLVVVHRGQFPPPPGTATGRITMWDITVSASPALVWTFPSSGSLYTPHAAMLRPYGGRWWLLYAHTEGGIRGSSMGLAVTDDPLVQPEYVADLTPSDPVGDFAFLRGVELTPEGTLWLTDSGPLGAFSPAGRVVSAPMPELTPTGATGAFGVDQVFVELTGDVVVRDLLDSPFEAWLWKPPAAWVD